MNTTRFLVTGILAIFFGSLPFAAMTTTAAQVAQIQPGLSPLATDQARLASVQDKACNAMNALGCP
jgi:hypothetical protein